MKKDIILLKSKTIRNLGGIKLICIITIFMSCNKSTPKADFATMSILKERENNGTPVNYISSVSLHKGKYLIDTNIINKNGNKKTLIDKLEFEKLIEKKSKEEIPDFILSFLDSISTKRKFDLANPNEEWQIGISNLGKQVIKKVWDENKKDSVLQVSFDGSHLPSKQLAYFGLGNNIALLSYYCGGISMTQYAIIIQFDANKITDFWFGQTFDFGTSKKSLINNIRSTGTKSGVGSKNGKC